MIVPFSSISETRSDVRSFEEVLSCIPLSCANQCCAYQTGKSSEQAAFQCLSCTKCYRHNASMRPREFKPGLNVGVTETNYTACDSRESNQDDSFENTQPNV